MCIRDSWNPYVSVPSRVYNSLNWFGYYQYYSYRNYYYDGNEDPTGTYTMDPVPDSYSTFELLAGALIAVATVASRKRNRAACGA